MKKLIATLLLILIFTCVLSAVELNSDALTIREKMPKGYMVIKMNAELEYPNEPLMRDHKINIQSKAAFDLFMIAADFYTVDIDIFFMALKRWSIGTSRDDNFDKMLMWFDKIVNGDVSTMITFFELPVDWSMMKYEYDKQLEAKGLL